MKNNRYDLKMLLLLAIFAISGLSAGLFYSNYTNENVFNQYTSSVDFANDEDMVINSIVYCKGDKWMDNDKCTTIKNERL